MQGVKRTFHTVATETTQPNKQQYVPRVHRPPFPPRGTATKPIQSSTATTSQFMYTDEIDYNDIQSLRAYAIYTQQHQQYEENHDDQNLQELNDSQQEADWDPDMNL
jgi:hypothetical protein